MFVFSKALALVKVQILPKYSSEFHLNNYTLCLGSSNHDTVDHFDLTLDLLWSGHVQPEITNGSLRSTYWPWICLSKIWVWTIRAVDHALLVWYTYFGMLNSSAIGIALVQKRSAFREWFKLEMAERIVGRDSELVNTLVVESISPVKELELCVLVHFLPSEGPLRICVSKEEPHEVVKYPWKGNYVYFESLKGFEVRKWIIWNPFGNGWFEFHSI